MKAKISKSGWLTSSRERRVYWLYFLGQNAIYSFITFFLATYLLLNGLDAAATAFVLLVVKVWDAVNDIIFGSLIDKIKFKRGGKFMPWLRISFPFILFATLLIFAIPQSLGMSDKLIWLAGAYILFDTAYTICDIPIYGLVTTMTKNQSERTDLMAKSRITSYSGTFIALILGTVLPSEAVGVPFYVIATIIVAIGFITMIWQVIIGRERTLVENDSSPTYSLREMFVYLWRNKYLLIFFIGLVMFVGLNTAQTLTTLVSYYHFSNALIATVLALAGFAPTVVMAAFLPLLIKYFDKHKMLMVSAVAYTLMSIVIWLVGPLLVPHIILSVLRGFTLGGVVVLQFMFTPDCVEYGEYITGTEAKGITFAVQTFAMKLSAALAATVGLFVMGFFGWQSVSAESFAKLAELGATQSEMALNGLWIAYTVLPAIGGVLCVLIWWFYRLSTEDAALMAQCNNGSITREECESRLSRHY